ncbi:MAG TPA: 7TM-DISM domain-containing protein, partial [Anaerolineales bacterium]|nr:7TM-DISM domain-containing protein [Anaerolineales bacterium]
MQYSGSGLLEKQKGSKSLLLNLFLITSAVILAFCMVRSVSAQQNSQPVLVLTSQKQEYLLGTYLEYLEDPKGELTFEQVRSAQYDSKFSTGKQDILNFGTTDSVYWLRLRIRNDASTAAKWRLELARPTVNTIILYIPEKTTSQYVEKKTGFVYPFATRDIEDESFIFNLPIESGSEQIIYMSIKDKVLDLPLRIWETDTLGRREQNSHTLVGFAFGALIIMFIYNLFITIMLWDKGFLYYSCFLIAMIFYLGVGQGYVSHYLWPEQTVINTFIVPLSIEFAMMGLLLFAGSFLQVTKQSRGWRIAYQILLTLIGLSIIPTP